LSLTTVIPAMFHSSATSRNNTKNSNNLLNT
jgi:hypothetical protein